MNIDNMIFEKLKEAVIVAESTEERYDFDKVSKEMRRNLLKSYKIKLLITAVRDLDVFI